MDAREVALLTLNACQRQGGWSDGVLKKQLSTAGLDNRDAALATQLCFGVVQNQFLLDFYLSNFSNIPLKRMEGKVIQALRLGAYQLLFMDKIPHSAAVNRSVDLVKRHCKNQRAVGMVNAVLRSLERSLDNLPVIPNHDTVNYLSILYSHPEWLVKEYMHELDVDETTKLLAAHNAQPPMTVMVNTTKVTQEVLARELTACGVEVQLHPWLSDCLILSKTGNLEHLRSFQEGWFYVQDPASRLAIQALDPQPGDKLLDCCAAPGGKSFACAIAMKNEGNIISCDLHPHKKKLIQAGANRLGLSCIEANTLDARTFREEWAGAFDKIVVDAPCSGLGVIRKKPDIRYKEPGELDALPSIQLDILRNTCRYVKSGGTLLYSTCTVRKGENEGVVNTFLNERPEFKAERFTLSGPAGACEDGMVTLWPHRHGTDGFFICKLRKEE